MSSKDHHIQKTTEIISPWLAGARIRPGILSAHFKCLVAGKIYDTKTATQVATFYHYPSEHYYSLEEYLYQNKNGKFFLACEGMGGTPYGYKLDHGNEYVRGHVLLPLTEEQTKIWLEMRELLEEYIEIFGTPDEAS